jgi:cell division protein FtsW
MRSRKIDKPFLVISVILLLTGFFIFSSASLGLLTREGAKLSSVMFNQIVFGIFLGGIALFVASKYDYLNYRKYSFYIFVSSLILTALVFTPLGMEHGGAKRWLDLGFLSFQPAEFLKLSFVMYFSAWLAGVKTKVKTIKFGVIPFFILLGLVFLVLYFQPDNGTFLVISLTAFSMFFVAGAKWKHLLLIFLIAIIGFASIIYMRPYVLDRVMTFIHPTEDTLGSGYQINQSLIAIGSGQIFGRGFGKSIQKFNFLPEPTGDSVFAVSAEEWGFVGSFFLISLFMLFAYRGLYVASYSNNEFGRLLSTGIVILILSQSFLNIASMMGLFPLTGMPLLFVSHGGTALMFTLLEVGIILNISTRKIY